MRIKRLFTLGVFLMVSIIALGQGNKLETAKKYEAKGDSLRTKASTKNIKDAISNFEKASPIFQSLGKFKDYFICQLKISDLLERLSSFDKSLAIMEMLSKKVEARKEKDEWYTRKILARQGWLLFRKRKFKESEKILKKALEWQLRAPSLTKALGEIYNNLGNLSKSLNKTDTAMIYYRKALATFKKLFGEKGYDVAGTYNNISRLYFKISDFKRATYYDNKALKVNREKFGDKHPATAGIYLNIGTNYFMYGDYETALMYFKKTLDIRKAFFGDQHIDVGVCYNNIGMVYGYLDAPNSSIEYFQKFLTILKKQIGEKHPYVVITYTNIGSVYLKLKDLKNAYKCFQKANQLFNKFGFKDKNLQARVLSYLGEYHRIAKNYKKSIDYLNQSIRVCQKFSKVTLGENYIELGKTYRANRTLDSSAKYFQLATVNFENILTKKSNSYSDACVELSKDYMQKGEYIKALGWLQKSLIGKTRNFNDATNVYASPTLDNTLNQPELIEIVYYKAKIFFELYQKTNKKEDLKQAVKNYDLCYELINKIQIPFLKASDKISFKNRIYALQEDAFKAYLEKYKTDKDQNNIARVFKFSEQFKASVLKNTIDEAKALKFAQLPTRLNALLLNVQAQNTDQVFIIPTSFFSSYRNTVFIFHLFKHL